tara:strand:+ start:273 stop:857 length:585 start_codon:yes stop_codon:yes gene_type:complete
VDECNEIIELTNPHMRRSLVDAINPKEIDPVLDKGRTSSNVFLSNIKGDRVKELEDKINNIVYSHLKIPIRNYESLQVVKYKSTEKYDAHYDACDLKKESCRENVKYGGLRYATFIIYLNDNFTGGETDFPLMNKKITPKKGKGVLFFNLNDDSTEIREKSFHAGLPPKSGIKWMCNKWIRLNDYSQNPRWQQS